MIIYSFNSKTGIVESVIKGEITIEDLSDYLISLSKDFKLPKILRIFTNASDANFSFEITNEVLKKIVDANNKSLKNREKIFTAFILSTPIETAMAHLYKIFSKTKNYSFEIFSTKEAALKWLKKS